MPTLDHVQVAIPRGGEESARSFYGQLLGLREIPKPEQMAGRGGCWFEVGALQLHLGVEEDFRPARKAHIALAFDDLSLVQDKLAAHGCHIRSDQPIEGRMRFFSEDPFGNRIELIEMVSNS